MVVRMKEKVAVIQCESYEDPRLLNRLQQGIEHLGGWKEFIKVGDKVLLKPNLLVGRPTARCVNTHPLMVKAIARMVMDSGCKVIIGDSPQLGPAKKAAVRCGLADAVRELGVEVVDFEPVEIKFPEGKVFKTLTIGKPLLEVDKVINLPKLKTHSLTCLTLSVKNLFGYIPGARKAEWHVKTSQAGKDFLAQLFLELHNLIRPVLNIVDGIMAMEGRGPGFGDPRHLGLLIMGRNALAVDRVIAEIVSAPVDLIPTLKVAKEKGYGYAELDEIAVVGDPLEAVRVKDFKLPPRTEIPAKFSQFQGLPKPLLHFLKKQITAQPQIDHNRCQECRMCLDACPLGVISSKEASDKGKLQIDQKRCIQCLCCIEACPHAAVISKPGFLLRVYNYMNLFLRSGRA
jgi:uncharacterized protein (DUF362 family)/Pyruvate/2-oxoacid:ferredoxin oxidoreductase delta subunit